MFEALDKLMLAGLGAISMTKERAEKIFDEYVGQGQTAKANRSGFVKELMDTADKTRKDFEKLLADQIHQTVSKLNFPSRDDLQRIEKKLDQLLERGR